MAFGDLFSLLDVLDLAKYWRIRLGTAAGGGAALGLHWISDGSPAVSAVCLAVGLAGLVFGIVWHLAQRRLH